MTENKTILNKGGGGLRETEKEKSLIFSSFSNFGRVKSWAALKSGEYNLTFAPPSGGGKRNQKSEIREENSKLIRKRRDKKGGEEKNGKKKGGKGRKKEKIKERTEKIS